MKKPPKKSEPPFEIRSFFIQFSIFRSALPLRSSKNFQFSILRSALPLRSSKNSQFSIDQSFSPVSSSLLVKVLEATSLL